MITPTFPIDLRSHGTSTATGVAMALVDLPPDPGQSGGDPEDPRCWGGGGPRSSGVSTPPGYDGPAMRSLRGRLVIATLIVVSAVVAAACTDASRPSSRAPSVAPSPTALAAASPTPKVTDATGAHRRPRWPDRQPRSPRDPSPDHDQDRLGRDPRRGPRRLPALPGRRGRRVARRPGRAPRSSPPPASTRSRRGIATRSTRPATPRSTCPIRSRTARGCSIRRPTCPSAGSRRPSARPADRR